MKSTAAMAQEAGPATNGECQTYLGKARGSITAFSFARHYAEVIGWLQQHRVLLFSLHRIRGQLYFFNILAQ
jgi:hypothetical protein